jgi:hypothetical protein
LPSFLYLPDFESFAAIPFEFMEDESALSRWHVKPDSLYYIKGMSVYKMKM